MSEREPKPVIIHCPRPGCVYATSARTEGRAITGIVSHIVQAHVEQEAAPAAWSGR